MTRSDASSHESCAPIGPWASAARPLQPEVVSFIHPVRHGRAVELSCTEQRDMNRLAPNSRAVLWQLAECRISPACPFGQPRHSAVGTGQCACSIRTPSGPSGLGRAARLYLVATALRRRCEEARDDLCHLREILLAEVVSEGRL